MATNIELPEVMTPHEVAERFGVDSKTVARWSQKGQLASFRTPGGHRRYRRVDVEKFLVAHGG